MTINYTLRSRKRERICLRQSPITNPGQVLRAILLGLLFAFLFVQALPDARLLFLSQGSELHLRTPT